MPYLVPVAAAMVWVSLVLIGLGCLWLLGERNPGWYLLVAGWASVVSFFLVGFLFARDR